MDKQKKRANRLNGRKFVVTAAALAAGILLLNMVLTYRIASEQAEQIGRMRVQNIAANYQRSLTRSENVLERLGTDLEALMQEGAGEEEIRHFLTQQKELEYDSSGGLCLNVFCVVDGEVWISGMMTPPDYVLQDRAWYRGLQATPKGEVYFSPAYDDAFTDNMCYTVGKVLSDGVTIAAMDYSVSEIQEFVKELAGDGYGEALIVDSNEVIVGYSDPAMVGKKLSVVLPEYRDAFLRAVASDEANISLKSSKNGPSTIFCSKTENGWYLMCSVSSRELYQDSYMLLLRGVLLTVFLIAVAAAVYFVLPGLRQKKQSLQEEKKRQRDERRQTGKEEGQQNDITAANQRKFQAGITVILVIAMLATIVICARMNINESRIKMEDEVLKYNYAVGDWILEQKSILDMFENVVVAKPELLDSYEGMVKFLDDITKHYPKISATYIANPQFAHGHPMVMNNGWVPEEDYVEEERVWYTGALTAEDFNITEPYYDARTGEYCITFSKVVQSEQGEFYGVFAIDFYLDVLTNILGESYSEQGYAFLVDKNGLIIDHPNSAYEFSDDNPVNIHDLVYDKFYSEDGMVTFTDFDGKLKVGSSLEENVSGFRLFVVKNWWSIYGNVLEHTVLFFVLFGVCIVGINLVMNRMIQWQQKANDDLREMAASAIRAEQAKSLFLSNMSHEIRTPINAVLGMNEMILRECNDSQLLTYAENIQSSGKTLLFLINDILDMSKIESGKMEIVPVEYDLGELVLDLWNVICLRAQEKGLAITFEVEPEMPAGLYGDDLRIKQIITNLLTNAVKYTPQGSVKMKVSYEKVSDKKLALTVSVKDTGIGIRKEDIGKLFEEFKRLDAEKNRRIEGTGLGMNITMSLLNLMEGKMQVDSVYGEGSTFTVTIPQTIVEETPVGSFEEIQKKHRTEVDTQKQIFEAPEAKVLVVDDNAMNLAVFQALLKRTKVQIDTADSGRACLALVQKEKYHIIFMDHMMPEMDGIQTLHEMRKDADSPNKDTPVIVLTANAIVGAKEMYLQEGFENFLSKPIEGELLEKMVREYLPEELIRCGEDVGETVAEEEKEGPEGEGGDGAVTEEQEERYLKEGISIRQGLSYAGGNRDVYLDLMEMFLKGKEQQEQNLKGFLEAENMADYGIQAHALKGNARTLGADRLADIAFLHEKAGKGGQLAYAKEHWEELAEEWEKCRRSFDVFYHEYREDAPEKYAAVSGGETVDVPAEELEAIRKLLDEFQTPQATERLKSWLEKPLEPAMHEKLRDALLAIEEEFDEDKAIEILSGS